MIKTQTIQAQEAPAQDVEVGLGRSRFRRGRGGFIAIELVLVTLVMLVALQIFAQIMLATSRQRSVNRENSTAMEASRSTVEHLMSLPIEDIFALYNDNPADDPLGPGTAPGSSFAVKGLTPASSSTDGLQGSISFPVATTTSSGSGLGGMIGTSGSSGTFGPQIALREDVVDRDLGMPRDLDGDGIIDSADHSGNYSILPVRITITWRGRSGDRSVSQHVLLTEMGL